MELGRYLCEVRARQYWRLEQLSSFDEFLERRFPGSRRKAYYLMSIHEHLPRQMHRDLRQLGWSKATELAKLARRQGRRFDCAKWLHKARELPFDPSKQEIERALHGPGAEPGDLMYFKLFKSQVPVVEQALELAARMLGSDRSRGYCLEMICADFLAGASLEPEHGEVLLLALERLVRFLPPENGHAWWKDWRLRHERESLPRGVWQTPSAGAAPRRLECQQCGSRVTLQVHHRQHRARLGADREISLRSVRNASCTHVMPGMTAIISTPLGRCTSIRSVPMKDDDQVICGKLPTRGADQKCA